MTAKTLSLCATLAILILGAMAILGAQATRPGETMQLWEYHTEIRARPGHSGSARGAPSRTRNVRLDAELLGTRRVGAGRIYAPRDSRGRRAAD